MKSLFIFLFVWCFGHSMIAQSFLNGSFETNNEGTCNFNMGNLGFTMSMANTVAFGAGQEMDIQTNGCGYGNSFEGDWFVSLAFSGANPDAISIELNQPLVAGNTYTFFYHDQANTQFTNTAPLLVGLSTDANTFGTQIFTAQPVVNVWTERTVTFVAPNNGQFITLQSSSNVTNWNFIDNFYFEECGLEDINLDVTACLGETVTLDATTPGATYLWPDGTTLSTFQVTASGIYTATLEVADCNFNFIYNVNFVEVAVDLGADFNLCEGESATLSSGVPLAAHVWQDGSTNDSFEVTDSGIYSVEISLGSCSDSDEIEIIFLPLPVVNLGSDLDLCPGETAVLDATAPNATYEWQDGSTSAAFNVSAAGQYNVSVTVDNCSASDQIEVAYYPFENTTTNHSLCEGEIFTLADGTSQSTSGSYTVNINSPVTGCPVTITVNLLFNPPTFSTVDLSLCQGQAAQLPDGSEVTQPGTYVTVLPSAVTGCPHTTTTNLVTFPGYSTNTTAEICQGETFTLPDGTEISASGSYPVVFSTSQGCDSTVITQLVVHPLPEVSFNWQPEKLNLLDPLAQFTSVVSNADSLEWSFSDLGTSQLPNPQFTFPYTLPGFYDVCLTATSNFGCQSTQCAVLEVFSELNFWCPNAFTPDSDGINDVFKPVLNGHNPDDYLFEIYDRWGQKVFSTTDPEMAWTGNHTEGNHFVQNDIYVWRVTVQTLGVDNRQIYSGQVLILR